MHFNEVCIIPACGYFGDEGTYDPGASYLNLMEVDVINHFVKCLRDSLEFVKLPYRVLPTLKKPGLSTIERFDFIERLDFVIHLEAKILKGKGPHVKNETLLHHGKGVDQFLLKGLEENCREYGKLASFYHRQQKSVEDPSDKLLMKSEPRGVRLSVFQLNGPDIDNYYKLIPHLAKSFALTLEESRRFHKSGGQKERW